MCTSVIHSGERWANGGVSGWGEDWPMRPLLCSIESGALIASSGFCFFGLSVPNHTEDFLATFFSLNLLTPTLPIFRVCALSEGKSYTTGWLPRLRRSKVCIGSFLLCRCSRGEDLDCPLDRSRARSSTTRARRGEDKAIFGVCLLRAEEKKKSPKRKRRP